MPMNKGYHFPVRQKLLTASGKKFLFFIVLLLLIWELKIFYNQFESLHMGRDFIAYWSAGRLLLTGNNPYSPEQLLAIQKTVGWTYEKPLLIYNPPWIFVFFLPFCLLKYTMGKFIWFLFNLGLIFVCADWAWRFYGGPNKARWYAPIVAFIFIPTLFLLKVGQIDAIILLGLLGFLHFEKQNKTFLAGMFTLLIAIKPQILFLFWLAFLFWIFNREKWSAMLGCLTAFLISMSLPIIYDPDIISQFINIIANQSPAYLYISHTIGSMLRLFFGSELHWLQFAPTILGALWFLFYWRKHKKTWEWSQEMPLILFVSLLTTFYGWHNDYVILLLPALQIASLIIRTKEHRKISLAITLYLSVNCVALVMDYLWGYLMVLIIPLLFGPYLILRKEVQREKISLSDI